MATVPEILERIGRLESELGIAWIRLDQLGRAYRDAGDELNDAIILAARDPEQTAAIAALSTNAEAAVRFVDAPSGIRQ